MRRLRLRGDGVAYYHVMSRVIERKFYLGEREKEYFRSLMWRVAGFSGVKILTYALMDNHFHMLIEVSERVEIDDDELLRRLSLIYREDEVDEVRALLENCKKEHSDSWAEAVRQGYLYRMYDLSEFMKTLKQRFSIWYNRRNDRHGTLWEDRFKSVLVEGPVRDSEAAGFGNEAVLTMAAYIDLNAVRAGLVDDPKDYRWCGYAEAVAGCRAARCGLAILLGIGGDKPQDWKEAVRRYRMLVFEEEDRCGVDRERMREVLDSGGKLSYQDVLRCRVRYFSDGMVLGSRAFVEDVFGRRRSFFGAKRKTGARVMRGGDWGNLCVARDLQKEVIS